MKDTITLPIKISISQVKVPINEGVFRAALLKESDKGIKRCVVEGIIENGVIILKMSVESNEEFTVIDVTNQLNKANKKA